MEENMVDLELYNASLERRGVQLASKVDNTNYSRTGINKVYAEQVKEQTKNNDEGRAK